MKIRISDQSLRIRLSTDEAIALEKGAFITTVLQLNSIDRFEVELSTWHLTIGEVQREPNKLLIFIPHIATQKLLNEPGFMFHCEQESQSPSPLRLEVEIDLQKVKRT
jgi:hypothetical protein